MSQGVGAPEVVTALATGAAVVLSATALATLFVGAGVFAALEYSFLAVALLGFGLGVSAVIRAYPGWSDDGRLPGGERASRRRF